MATPGGDRSAQFPAIERRYGQPVSFWLERLGALGDSRYGPQMAFLQEEHGFTRAHANTLVMYARGSTSTRRFESAEDYFAAASPAVAATGRAVLEAARRGHRDLETVIAWNNPMLRRAGKYVFGVAAGSDHLLLLPWGQGILDHVAARLDGLVVNKKTVRVPAGWTVDRRLVSMMVAERLRQLDEGA